MPTKPTAGEGLRLFGAGGHARVVIEAARLQGWTVLGVIDDRTALHGGELLGAPIGPEAAATPGCVHVAVGDNVARAAILRRLAAQGWRPTTVTHPRASVSPSATLGSGCFVAALAVVGPCADVSAGAIINHGAVVDHDCRLGEAVHVAPNATLGGGCRVGDGALVGAGAVMLPGRVLGAGARLGAGAVLTHDLPDGAVAVGAPARPMQPDTCSRACPGRAETIMTTPTDPLILHPGDSLDSALARFARTDALAMLVLDAEGRPVREVRPIHLRRMMTAGFPQETALSSLPPAQPVTTAPAGTPAARLQALMTESGAEVAALIDAAGRAVAAAGRDRTGDRILLSPPHMGGEEEMLAAEAFATNWIAPLGPNVDAFEAELADYLGVPAAAALSSGTAALHLALRLAEVGPGDVVLASTLTFIGSVAPILYQGARPFFVDSEPESWNMAPAAFERALDRAIRAGTPPKAAIVTNIYGQSADLAPIMEIAQARGVSVIEDAAESLGATYRDRMSGAVAPLAALSFNGNKIITTSGGGALVGADPEHIARARFLSTQARDPASHYQHATYGYNYRMSNILAGVGRGQLRLIEARVQARRRIFDRYREALADAPGVVWMPEAPFGRCNRWLTVAMLDPDLGARRGPREVAATLGAEGIEARPVWKPMHRQPVFAGASYEPLAEGRSFADHCFDHGLCLPSGSAMTDDQIQRVADAIARAIG